MRREHRTGQADNPWNNARIGAKTNSRLHSYSVRVVEKWNSLPDSRKSMEKVDAFKRALRKVNANETRIGVLRYQKKCECRVSESERTRQVDRQFYQEEVLSDRWTTRMPDVHLGHLDGTNWTIPQVYPRNPRK